MRQATRTPGNDLVGQGADVHERAGRVDQLGKAAVLDAAVDVLDLDRCAADACQRMQHDEAGAVGDEVGERLAFGREGRLPEASASIRAAIGEGLLRVPADGVVGDSEAAARPARSSGC